jgi:hypothetical protein
VILSVSFAGKPIIRRHDRSTVAKVETAAMPEGRRVEARYRADTHADGKIGRDTQGSGLDWQSANSRTCFRGA